MKHYETKAWNVNEGILFTENDYNYRDFEELENKGWKCPIEE